MQIVDTFEKIMPDTNLQVIGFKYMHIRINTSRLIMNISGSAS